MRWRNADWATVKSIIACVTLYSQDNAIGVSHFLYITKTECLTPWMRVNSRLSFLRWINICLLKKVSRLWGEQITGLQKRVTRSNLILCRVSQVLRLTICAIWIHIIARLWCLRRQIITGGMLIFISGELNMQPVTWFTVVSGTSFCSTLVCLVRRSLLRSW